jgi:hypothetical protein
MKPPSEGIRTAVQGLSFHDARDNSENTPHTYDLQARRRFDARLFITDSRGNRRVLHPSPTGYLSKPLELSDAQLAEWDFFEDAP